MAAAKGLILLDSKSSILHEQLQPRILEGKREPCEITFFDFDDVQFKVSCQPNTPQLVRVNMAMRHTEELKRYTILRAKPIYVCRLGSAALLDRVFPGMQVAPDPGYTLALEIDCDNLSNPAATLAAVADMKRHLYGGPLDAAFTALAENRSSSVPPCSIEIRKGEVMYICPQAAKVVVIFLVDFAETTDKALAKVFLQEFVEAQRTVRTAPPVSYSKEPPGEIAATIGRYNTDSAGFISFALEERHIRGAAKDTAITLLTGFRNYLHYHIKSSKTYLHMRMRKRVAGWLQVLNRAVPEVETEKKLASGKTFQRK